MTYDQDSRKRNSKAIIDIINYLNQEETNYKKRISDSVNKIIEEGDDATNRENLVELTHLYTDNLEELKCINRYQWRDGNVAVNFLTSLRDISINKYMAGWSDFFKAPPAIKDCGYLWDIFYPYSSNRDTDRVRSSCLWNNNDLRATNTMTATPNTPSVSDFQNSIVPINNISYIAAVDIPGECQKAKNIILNGNYPKSRASEYSVVDFAHFDYLTPAGSKISYSGFNGKTSYGYNTYTVNAQNYIKHKYYYYDYDYNRDIYFGPEKSVDYYAGTYKYAQNLINTVFKVGTIHFFSSDDNKSFGFGRVVKTGIKVDRAMRKPDFPSWPGSSWFSDWLCDYYDYYYLLNYSATITFEFIYINGNDPMKPFGNITDNIAINVLRTYHKNLLSILNTAYTKYQDAWATVRTNDFGKYQEYIKYLTEANYDSLSNAVIVNNTCINSIKDWVNLREKKLLETIRDEDMAEAYRSIIMERMNKNNGTLFAWYAQETIPIADAYIAYKQKIQNNLYIFRTMLVAHALDLDYNLAENGGQEKPPIVNYIDIDKDRYPYYTKAGKPYNFKKGDIVCIMDDNNPEIRTRVTNVKNWIGKYNDEAVNVKRIYVEATISSVYNTDSLRIVKVF